MARRKRTTDSAPPPETPDIPPAPMDSTPPPPVRSLYDLAGSPERGILAMNELAEQQGRVYGRNNMLPLKDAPYARIRRMFVGIFWFDLRTRGLVLNRINRIWGPPSTLKSTLVLRAIRAAQRHCRHCHYPLVMSPVTGRLNCRCPDTRFWLLEEADYAWLTNAQGLALQRGELPEGAEIKKIAGQDGRVCAVLKCPPPPRAGEKAKAKEIIFAETWRCEPKRTLLCDSERTTDIVWVELNGVNAALVGTLGAKWGEQSLDTINEVVLLEKALDDRVGTQAKPDKRVDLIAIDSTSMLETMANLEKGLAEAPKVASKAHLLGRWTGNFLSACAEEGLTARYSPTVLTTSQISTHGLGGGPRSHSYLAPTDGWKFQHGIALDVEMREAGYEFNDTKTRARWGNFEFNVRKNKAGGSVKVTGSIKFWVTPEDGHPVGDSDDVETVMAVARKLGEQDGKGPWIAPGPSKNPLIIRSPYLEGGERGFSKVGDVERFLHENPSVYEDMRTRVLEHLIADPNAEEYVLVALGKAESKSEKGKTKKANPEKEMIDV